MATLVAPAALPVPALILPSGCGQPGCLHHYLGEPEGCSCVLWPADRGVHVFAPNPLCRAHPTVAEWVLDAADVLAVRDDYLDPDAVEYPPGVLAELMELALAGPCGTCISWPNPTPLADHFIARKRREWIRSLPTWRCDCGARYKRITDWGSTRYYPALRSGLMGDSVGYVQTTAKGKVKHSDACPRCRRSFADTVARQLDPQGSLF